MEKSFKEFLELFEQLSPELQEAVCLLISNMESIDEWIAEDDTPPERLEQLIIDAKERKDIFAQVVFKYILFKKYGVT